MGFDMSYCRFSYLALYSAL